LRTAALAADSAVLLPAIIRQQERLPKEQELRASLADLERQRDRFVQLDLPRAQDVDGTKAEWEWDVRRSLTDLVEAVRQRVEVACRAPVPPDPFPKDSNQLNEWNTRQQTASEECQRLRMPVGNLINGQRGRRGLFGLAQQAQRYFRQNPATPAQAQVPG